MADARRVVFFGASWVTVVFLNAYIIAPAPVFVPLMEALQVGNAAVGALVAALLLTAVLVQIPGAYLIDRVDNRFIVTLAGVGLTAASVPPLLLHTYETALLSRLLGGLFIPLSFVPLTNLLSDAFPQARIRALGGLLSAAPAGYGLGTFLTPLLPDAAGLPFIYIAYALPVLFLTPVLFATSRGLAKDRGPPLSLRQYGTAFRSLDLWKLGLAFVATYALYILFTSWMPSYLTQVGGFSLAVSGGLAALVPLFGILSRPLGGFLAETLFRGDKRRVPLLAFLVLIPLCLVWIVPAVLGWALLLLPLLGFFIQLPFSVYYAFSAQILPERLTGAAYTFTNSISLVGGVFAPVVAGVLVDTTGAFPPVFLFAAGLAGVGAVLVATSRER